MGALNEKAEWVDSVEDGEFKCDHCTYKTTSNDFLEEHSKYHSDKSDFVLYMECMGSLDGRNAINDNISAAWIDCTGGQSAYADGDINKFGQEIVEASRKTNNKLYRVLRIHDPGLGLVFADWWVDGGIEAGVFEQYDLPDDVLVLRTDEEKNDVENGPCEYYAIPNNPQQASST